VNTPVPMRERARALQMHRAGFVSRLGADAVDLVTAYFVFLLVLFTWGTVVFLLTPRKFSMPDPGPAASVIGVIVVQTVYLGIAWSGENRSVGKLLLGLRVVRSTGRRLSLARSLARAAFCTTIGQPGLLLVPFSRKNAAVHDLVFDTAVVYDWRSRTEHAGAADAAAGTGNDGPGALTA
jgi:uncharacterized RDD family membrane protein YckC